MTHAIHPADVLFDGEVATPTLPAVDHYAGNQKLITKALQLQQKLGPLFDISCDCEDGAPVGAEADHAQMCAAAIMSSDNHFNRVGARIHDITHPHWGRDLEILIAHAGQRIAYITLPKPRGAADVAQQIDLLRRLETDHNTGRATPVHVLIETHGALHEVFEIAALSGVESIDFGLMDFVSAHQGAIPASAMTSPGQFDHPLVHRAKTEIATAALGRGCVPTHNVTTELIDTERVFRDAQRARTEFGYLRMWSIHPKQIEPILRAMRPNFDEVTIAAEILLAAQANHWGPIRHQGKLHDRASFRYYWALLRRAEATGCSIPNQALGTFFQNSAKKT